MMKFLICFLLLLVWTLAKIDVSGATIVSSGPANAAKGESIISTATALDGPKEGSSKRSPHLDSPRSITSQANHPKKYRRKVSRRKSEDSESKTVGSHRLSGSSEAPQPPRQSNGLYRDEPEPVPVRNQEGPPEFVFSGKHQKLMPASEVIQEEEMIKSSQSHQDLQDNGSETTPEVIKEAPDYDDNRYPDLQQNNGPSSGNQDGWVSESEAQNKGSVNNNVGNKHRLDETGPNPEFSDGEDSIGLVGVSGTNSSDDKDQGYRITIKSDIQFVKHGQGGLSSTSFPETSENEPQCPSIQDIGNWSKFLWFGIRYADSIKSKVGAVAASSSLAAHSIKHCATSLWNKLKALMQSGVGMLKSKFTRGNATEDGTQAKIPTDIKVTESIEISKIKPNGEAIDSTVIHSSSGGTIDLKKRSESESQPTFTITENE